jgi:hypothetical protein
MDRLSPLVVYMMDRLSRTVCSVWLVDNSVWLADSSLGG